MREDPRKAEAVRSRIGSARGANLTHPAQVEGRGSRRGRRLRSDKPQGIRQGAVIHEAKFFNVHSCTVVEVVVVDFDPTIGDPNRPEEPTWGDVRAYIVQLVSVGRQRIYLILIDIESDEPERSLMAVSVHANVLTPHEPVVAVEQQ